MTRYPAHKRYEVTYLSKDGEWKTDISDAGHFLYNNVCPECLEMGQIEREYIDVPDGMSLAFRCMACEKFFREDYECKFSWGGYLYELD